MQGLEALDQFKSFVSKIGGLGRYEDTYIVHAAEGETVVPMEVLDRNPVLKKRLFKTMMDMGIEPGRYIVGNELNSKNPVTGQPEFFLKQIGRRLRKAAADISGYAAPIIGAMYGAPAGAAAGALLGQYKRENPGDPTQGLQMALRGGLAGIGSNIAGGQNPFLGKGFSNTGMSFTDMLKSPFTKGGREQLKDYITKDSGEYESDLLQKIFGKSSEERLFESTGDELLQEAYTDLANAKTPFAKQKIMEKINTLQNIKTKDSSLFGDLSIGQLAGLYGLGTAGLGFLIDKTSDEQDVGLPADTMPQGNVLTNILNPTKVYAASGGVLDLQDGGEAIGPGTGTSDSIPAMLSDGEFVMTAEAVRGAGGGDRREGAKKMYEAMNKLEARA